MEEILGLGAPRLGVRQRQFAQVGGPLNAIHLLAKLVVSEVERNPKSGSIDVGLQGEHE